jgi:hypothetical protein
MHVNGSPKAAKKPSAETLTSQGVLFDARQQNASNSLEKCIPRSQPLPDNNVAMRGSTRNDVLLFVVFIAGAS